jgi:hypothetical protein
MGAVPSPPPQLDDSTVDSGRTTLLIEEIPGSGGVSVGNTIHLDVPRNSQKTALTGDPRNDENLIVSQLHLALLRFHNVVVGDVKAELGPGFTPGEIFEEPQRVVRWHYQWLIHSQVRPNYRANFGTSASDPTQQFVALIFDPAATDPDDPADLRGGRRGRAVSSTGIPSSTSATAGYAPTRRSTRSSRRSSST